MNKSELGSKTAKGGFANEKAICEKFNKWKEDKEVKEWLKVMGYEIEKIDSVKAIHIPIRMRENDLNRFEFTEQEYKQFVRFKKADVQIRIVIKVGSVIKVENLSLKKANHDANYNQIDKRTTDSYQAMWNFDEEIAFWLKLFAGELLPQRHLREIGIKKFRDKRRLFLNEMSDNIQNKIIRFFEKNRIMVVSDIVKGRGGLSADWMLVTKLNKENNTTTWILREINVVMNFFGGGRVSISPRGSLYIGKITMQRKGGTPDPTKLQFKIKPCQLFKLGE